MAAAMANETLHRDTLRALLAARGASPSLLRAFWWLAGQALGRATALLGRSTLLRGDSAFEEKAVREYAVFVGEGGFNEEERAFLVRFLADEKRHVANWKALLERT
jgi:demethoxyubiquinone hydroxylase (CLK1/Coq7/Cat5 family)